MADEVDLLFAVPLDWPMYLEPSVLGSTQSVTLKSSHAMLELPRLRSESPQEEGALEPPPSATERLSHHVEGWGQVRPSGRGVVAEVEQILLVVQVRADIPFEIGSDQVGSPTIDRFRQEIHSWLGSFVRWVWALTSQSLDFSHPDPKLIHRKSTNIIHVGVIDGVSSYAASGSPPLVIIAPSNGPCSERAVDERVLVLSLKRAGIAPLPLAMELLAAARVACRTGDRRRALIDAGTATEAALTRILGLQANHQGTLGSLVTLARNRGVSVPADAETSLLVPRNDAVHRGSAPSHASLCRALDITEQLVSRVEPDLIPIDSLQAVHRPQRQDVLLIRGPQARGDAAST
jgi:hypothetical protein